MYTSGCPKNQKRCWNNIRSPPPEGSKKDVLRFRSVSNIVMQAANTGRAKIRSRAVINKAQGKSGVISNVTQGRRIFSTVVIIFSDAIIEENPARCKEIMAKSTEGSFWPTNLERGGYTVQPVPTPWFVNDLDNNRNRDGGSSQNLKLFNRGNAISGAPKVKGINQFPKPPIKIGITAKNIIRNAWAVTITLYICPLFKKVPPCLNSRRIITLVEVPNIALQAPKIKYKVPISLWFVDQVHRFTSYLKIFVIM